VVTSLARKSGVVGSTPGGSYSRPALSKNVDNHEVKSREEYVVPENCCYILFLQFSDDGCRLGLKFQTDLN